MGGSVCLPSTYWSLSQFRCPVAFNLNKKRLGLIRSRPARPAVSGWPAPLSSEVILLSSQPGRTQSGGRPCVSAPRPYSSGDVPRGVRSSVRPWGNRVWPGGREPSPPHRKAALAQYKTGKFTWKGIFHLWKLAGIKGHWQLNFVQTFALAAEEDLLFCWFHKKMKVFAVSPQFPFLFFHKNKRWFFKVPVSALFDILLWVWVSHWANCSGWNRKFVVISTVHPQSCFPVSGKLFLFLISFFFLAVGKHCYYKNKKQ